VLFLGANPRDPIVRKLATRLVRPNSNQGKAFFVCSDYSAADELYWRPLEMTWLRAAASDVIAALTEQLP
jgi:hypothetical protein